MTMSFVRAIVLGATAAFLAGCGGGGDSGVVVSGGATVFPLRAGYQARMKAGVVDNYTVSDGCVGTARTTASAAINATFEGVAGFAVLQMVIANTTCLPGMVGKSITSFFDVNYAPLGFSTPNGAYEKLLTLPQSFPAGVKVGDSAVLATLTEYADNTQATVTGRSDMSYVVERDTANTANTAIVNVISKNYNAAGELLLTVQNRYRITADGTLTSTTIDMEYSNTNKTRLVLTKL